MALLDSWTGQARLKRFDRTLQSTAGFDFVADGWAAGDLVTVIRAGTSNFDACVYSMPANDTFFWSAVPVSWPADGTETVTLNRYPPSGYSAARPRTDRWDYAQLITNLAGDQCLTYQ